MEHFEMAETLSKKANVSLEAARQALMDNDWDMLDAMVALEKNNTQTNTVNVDASAAEQGEAAPGKTQPVKSMARENCENAKAGARRVWDYITHLFHQSTDNNFCIVRKEKKILTMPVLALVVLLLGGLVLHYLGLMLLLLVIGLFCGCQYHFEGKQAWHEVANNAMDKASDVAEDIREKFTNHDDNDSNINV